MPSNGGKNFAILAECRLQVFFCEVYSNILNLIAHIVCKCYSIAMVSLFEFAADTSGVMYLRADSSDVRFLRLFA